MTTYTICPSPVQQFLDKNGAPLSGGLLFTYAGGTTTKINTYTDISGVVPNTNPIVLDSLGKAPQAIFVPISTNVKFVLSPPGDTDPPTAPIWTVDNVSAPTTSAGTMALQDASNVNITGGVVNVGTLQCTGGTILSALTVSGTTTLNSGLTVAGAASFASTVSFHAAVTIVAVVSIDSNSLVLSATTADAVFKVQSFGTGFASNIALQNGNSTRWQVLKDATAESGANTGSNFAIAASDDTGVFNFNAVVIARNSGLVTLRSLLVTSNAGLTLANQTSGPGSGAGTLTNAPAAGNPHAWIPVVFNGTPGWIPWWHA